MHEQEENNRKKKKEKKRKTSNINKNNQRQKTKTKTKNNEEPQYKRQSIINLFFSTYIYRKKPGPLYMCLNTS